MKLVYASAGSGKTFQLAKEFVFKILNGEEINGVYCLSFTKKATQEIKDRVVLFAKKIINDDSELLSILKIKKVNKEQKLLLKNILINENKINVMTIDSFLYKILRFIKWQDQRLASVEEMFIIMEEASQRFLIENASKKNDWLNIVDKIKNIYIGKRASIEKLLEDTDSKNIYNLFQYNTDIENLKNKILESLMELATETTDANLILSEEDFITAFEDKFMYFGAINYRSIGKFTKTIQDEIKNISILVQAYREIPQLNKELKNVISYYEAFSKNVKEVKERKNIIDYNDILITLYKTLKYDILSEENLNYYVHNNIGHLLIDEYQDVSKIQDFLLEKIYKELESGANSISDKPTIFLVGDSKQSIYEWRDADSSIFEDKKNRFKNKPFTLVDKEDNVIKTFNNEGDIILDSNEHKICLDNQTRRIHPNIIKNINNIFSNSKLEMFEEHITSVPDNNSSEFKVIEVDNYSSYSEEIFKKVIELIENGKDYKDIAIIARNNYTLNQIEQDLKEIMKNNKKHFPIKTNQSELGNSKEIKFFNDLLLSVLSIENKNSYFNFLSSIGFEYKEIINHLNNKEKNDEINKLDKKIKKIKEDSKSLKTKIKNIIEEFDVFSYIFSINKGKSIILLNRYIEYLFSNIKYYKNTNDFINMLLHIDKNNTLQIDLEEDVNAVNLITIHKSKGLEWDTVILVEEGIFNEVLKGITILQNGNIYNFGNNKRKMPKGFKEFDDKYNEAVNIETNAQWKLYYVATTRQKNNLYLLR